MQPNFPPLLTRGEWTRIEGELQLARGELAASPAGISRQPRFDRLRTLERRASNFINTWLADAFDLRPVEQPRMVLSLDIDDVLEDEVLGFSITGVGGVAGLKLLQLGGVAVLLNTARSTDEVSARCIAYRLRGGVSAFGASLWDAAAGCEEVLISEEAEKQMSALRSELRSDPTIVIDGSYNASLRVSRIVDGTPAPIVGTAASALLERLGLGQLTYWVSPRHTDFVDRGVDTASGIGRLRRMLDMGSLPLAAMGDAVYDVPILRLARRVIVPAATLPSYVPPPGQRLLRARGLADASVWEAACAIVRDASLRRLVMDRREALEVPPWLAASVAAPAAITPATGIGIKEGL